ncbi:MAG: DUF1549 domain-containing protein, partial [Acetobacteraceae bacterium]
KKGLTASPIADKATLLRRVSLDLTGLPPTEEEAVAFMADPSPGECSRRQNGTITMGCCKILARN